MLAAATSLAGCGGQVVKAPTPKRPIDEGRALNIIAEVLRQEGLQAAPGQPVTLNSGKSLHIDVLIDGKIGIAYLTPREVEKLGSDPLSKRPKNVGDDLIVRTGVLGQDAIHYVVLYASDYVYDDNIGTEHEATIITAENKLQRDARDFVVIARKQGWR